MPATRAPEILDWLVAELPTIINDELERPAAGKVQVAEGWPGDRISRDHVIFDGYRTEQAEAGLGRGPRRETITFDVWIVAVCPGKSATDARAAVHNIADAMSGYFRTGSGWTLGGTACTGVFYPLKYKPGLSDKARSGLMRAELTATINRLS